MDTDDNNRMSTILLIVPADLSGNKGTTVLNNLRVNTSIRVSKIYAKKALRDATNLIGEVVTKLNYLSGVMNPNSINIWRKGVQLLPRKFSGTVTPEKLVFTSRFGLNGVIKIMF